MRRLPFKKCALALSALSLLGASRCAQVPIDASAAAAASNDNTVIFQTTGITAQRGYLYFQKRAGTLPSEVITVIVPKVNCSRQTCVSYQFFRQDGSLGVQGGMTKGSTQALVHLSDIIGTSDAVTDNEDGEFGVIVQVYFDDAEGHEHTVNLLGFIRLSVYAANYAPLGCNDPVVAFKRKLTKSCEVQFSTAGRSVVCGDCENHS